VVASLVETMAGGERPLLQEERRRLEEVLAPLLTTALEHTLPPAMPDEDLVNSLAQYLAFEPLEKLALLERQGPLERCRSIIQLLEMKAIAQRTPDRGAVH
jgi:Lon protease-like protein